MIDTATQTQLEQHILAAQATFFGTINKGTFEIRPNWARGFSGLPWPTYNIFLPRTPAGLNDDILAEAEAFFTDRHVFYCIELVHNRLPDGPDFLDKRGYQSLPPQPAMLLQEIAPTYAINPDIEISPVKTVPGLTAYCTIYHRVFDFPLADITRLFTVAQLKSDVLQHYLAFLDEQPAGIGTLICTEGMSSLWNICTLDQYRHQGVASTLISHMLGQAQAQNCLPTMLYSTAQAYTLFQKVGFEIYTQRQWFLQPGLDYDDEEDEAPAIGADSSS